MHRIKRRAHSFAVDNPISVFYGSRKGRRPDSTISTATWPMASNYHENAIDESDTNQPFDIELKEHQDEELHTNGIPPIQTDNLERSLTYGSAVEHGSSTAINSPQTAVDQNGANTLPEQSRSIDKDAEAGGSEGEKPQRASILAQLRLAICSSYINLLLVFAPVGIALHFSGSNVNASVIFVMNFIAIIPLAALLCFATEEVAMYVGETLGGLLNATFGNAVELIVSLIALFSDEVVIVQTSLVGSILSNLLLVLGMAFCVGGFYRDEQYFNTTVAQAASSLLALALAGLIIPTVFHEASSDNDNGINELSRAASIIMLVVYCSYLFFQLKSHAHLYNAPSQKVPMKKPSKVPANPIQALGHGAAGAGQAVAMGSNTTVKARNGEFQSASKVKQDNIDEDEEVPQLSWYVALGVLAGATVLVALCAEGMVDSIDALCEQSGISRVFVGLILLPVVGNAAEHVTAVTVAHKDKMDLSIGVAVGSSLQIALLVLPLMVVIGWIGGIDDMNLYFDSFMVGVLFISIVLVNYQIQDGKSNYLEGNMLVATYLIIAVAAWFYPKDGVLSKKTT